MLIYLGGGNLDTIPDFTFQLYRENNGGGRSFFTLDKPFDINGDNYDDFAVRRTYSVDANEPAELIFYYGSAEFDTIPDVVLTHDTIGTGFAVDLKTG